MQFGLLSGNYPAKFGADRGDGGVGAGENSIYDLDLDQTGFTAP
ncbi:MAG: hypothetical protein BWX60_00918 [Candidatus Marinimicrobia bacterium ADurb.Bin030]|nr:MAG: hypothetical protein BWX60_00918 [Candidatus Marinimicrobia bacterium ADurb.Bin030]